MPRILSSDDIEAFRTQLCDAAENLFAAHGPDGVTMRELADAVGVSAMTPYRYFNDKDALLAAVRTRAFTRFADAMEAFDAKARKRGPVDFRAMPRASFRARTDSYLDFALGHPASYRLMFDINQPNSGAYPDLTAAIARTRRTMAPMASDGTRVSAAAAAPFMMWSAVHGVIMLELSGLLGAPDSVRRLAHAAAEAIAEQLGILR